MRGRQASGSGPGWRPVDGLGAVGCSELAQDMADVLLDRVQADHEIIGDGPFGLPAASSTSAFSAGGRSGWSAMPGAAAVRGPEVGTPCAPPNPCRTRARQSKATPRAGACAATSRASSTAIGAPSSANTRTKPCKRGQAYSERLGVGELATYRDAVCDVP